jgi:hypothetical protein
MIQKLLAEYSAEEAAWIWWIDIDTVVANIALPLPLAKYDGYDLVAWGRREHVLEGRMNDGEARYLSRNVIESPGQPNDTRCWAELRSAFRAPLLCVSSISKATMPSKVQWVQSL